MNGYDPMYSRRGVLSDIVSEIGVKRMCLRRGEEAGENVIRWDIFRMFSLAGRDERGIIAVWLVRVQKSDAYH